MSSIADYIAKNYLSADKKKKKKKVKKKANASTVIHDDDDTTFKNSIDESDEEEKEKKRLLKESLKKEKEEKEKIASKFKTANESSWVTVDEGSNAFNNTTENQLYDNDKLNDDNDRGRTIDKNQDSLKKRKRVYSDDEQSRSRSRSRSNSNSRSRSRGRSRTPVKMRKRVYSDDESSISRSRSRSRSSSPIQKRKRVYSDDESSVSRSRSRSKSRSQSPIQKRSHEYSDEEADKNNKNVKDKTVRMSDGSLAGLQAGKDLKLDAKRKQRAQRELLARMTSEESGKHAKTIYRDKYGKKVDLAVEKAKMAAEERKKEAEAEKDMVWGKGLVQQREREELVRKLRKEKDRSFAVYKDDKELNEEQMEKDRWGDPMAKLIKKKSKSKTIRPKYNGPPPPPNRFNIEPGYRWDGVDRSNGFEEKYFQMKNQKESVSEVAYKWSTEDM